MPRPSRPINTANVRTAVKARKSSALSLALLALCFGAASSIISRTAHAQSQSASFAAPINKPYSSLGRRAASGDFNNDGRADLIVITGPGVGSPSSGYNVGVALGNDDGITINVGNGVCLSKHSEKCMTDFSAQTPSCVFVRNLEPLEERAACLHHVARSSEVRLLAESGLQLRDNYILFQDFAPGARRLPISRLAPAALCKYNARA